MYSCDRIDRHILRLTEHSPGKIDKEGLIHDIDDLRFVCGEIEHIYALTSSAARGTAVEDAATISCLLADDV